MRPLLDGLAGLSLAPGGAFIIGVTDLTAAGGLAPAYRGLVSFALVSLFGVGVLLRSREFVEGSVDASMARPYVSVFYGLIGFGLVAFVGFVGLTQLSYLGGITSALSTVVGVVVAVAALSLGGLGYTVVGTRLLEVRGARRPWHGLALGAALSAVCWVLLPPLAAALAWVLVPAVGIGGPVREWLHAERTTATEARS